MTETVSRMRMYMPRMGTSGSRTSASTTAAASRIRMHMPRMDIRHFSLKSRLMRAYFMPSMRCRNDKHVQKRAKTNANSVQAGCRRKRKLSPLTARSPYDGKRGRNLTLSKGFPMPQDPALWLRGHMREHLSGATAETPAKVVSLDRPTAGAGRTRGAAALELVARAAEAINDVEERANETEARAKSLVRGAIEKLHAAEARIEAAETARREVIDETAARLAEAIEALKRAEARVAAAEAEALAAETRAQDPKSTR